MAKFPNSIPGGRIGNLLAGAALASLIGGTAVAITSPDFTYSAAKQGYFTIDPMAMSPANAASVEGFSIFSANRLAGSGCYVTGINLPQGAIVASVTTWYSSNVSSNPSIAVYRHNLPTGAATPLVADTIADNSNTRKPITHTVPVSLRTVENLYFAYGYSICLGENTFFYGARINYLYNSAGD